MPIFGIFWQEFRKSYCDLKSAPSNLPICKISQKKKTKMAEFGTRNAWFMYFLAGIWKQYCHIWNQHPWIRLVAKFCEKTKCLNLRQKMGYLGIFCLELKKKKKKKTI